MEDVRPSDGRSGRRALRSALARSSTTSWLVAEVGHNSLLGRAVAILPDGRYIFPRYLGEKKKSKSRRAPPPPSPSSYVLELKR